MIHAVMKTNVTKHYTQQEMLKLFAGYSPDFEPGQNGVTAIRGIQFWAISLKKLKTNHMKKW